jgi:hypothetical protein
MRRTITLALTGLLAATAAWAQDDNSANTATTTTTTTEVTHGYLRDEKVGLKPEVGVAAYTDEFGNATSRVAVGFDLDWNILNSVAPEMGDTFLGIDTGLIYSHLGSPTSNFWGSSATTIQNASGNMFLIPADVKAGYTFADKYRLSVHGGGNIMYRSVASSLYLGDSSFQSGSVWRLFPNVGADLEIALGRNAALLLRPDVTLTPGNTLFTGMLALGVTLG